MQAVFLALMMQLSGIIALLVAVGFMLAVFGQIPINDVLIFAAALLLPELGKTMDS